jgi:hypothetical protein
MFNTDVCFAILTFFYYATDNDYGFLGLIGIREEEICLTDVLTLIFSMKAKISHSN